LRAFGWNLGIAFQLRDDYLDFWGEEKKLGKPVHQDEVNHAPNFVAELGFDGAMADLNGDGYDDLVIAHQCNGTHSDITAFIYYGGPEGMSERHKIELPPPQAALLQQYCGLLWDWNTKINLTRHTDYEKFVARDVVDSLAFAKFLQPNEKVLDVGTGGGVPGIVLAIVRGDLDVALCESVGKKALAVADIVDHLGLKTLVVHARAEDLLVDHRYNTLVIRAVARLKKLLVWFQPHWDSFDRLLVLKGPSWIEERGEARHFGLLHDLALRKLTSYPLPGTESESVLLQICPKERP
jgi:16S rRNA (guanine527-N7)-methyltransferase